MTKFNDGRKAEEQTMTRTMILAAMAALILTGCPVSDGPAMGGGDAGVPTADGGPVPASCEEDPAYTDVDGDGWCPSGRDLDADGFCCTNGESLPPEEGDCNDSARAINPGASEVCGNGIDEDCGESPCATPGSCPDPDTIDPDCGGTPACAPGLTRTCTTSCGSTTGVQACSGDGTWGACAPLTVEICGNGIDDNCAGGVDEGCAPTALCTPGAVVSCTTSCGSSGTQTCASDGRSFGLCNPPSGEICGNGIDDNCAGGVDEGCSSGTLCTPGAAVTCPTTCGSTGSQVCGADGRSYGACMPPSESCGNTRDDDCDGIVDEGCMSGMLCTPGAVQTCPTSCGSSGSQTCAGDGRSWGTCNAPAESCGNSRDDDCDGIVDNGCGRFYRDADGDGYGRSSDSVTGASAPSGYVSMDGDCNDSNASINPGRSEVCGNAIDDNCNGSVDEGCLSTTYYRDGDGDGYGTSSDTRSSSTGAPAGYIATSGDCNDSNSSVNPGAAERCDNSIDDDCDGLINEGCTCSTYYRDVDGDGYGSASSTTTSCTGTPSGYVATSGDCNDANASVHPGATEVCGDGVDNDCSGGDATCSGDVCGPARSVSLTFSAPAGTTSIEWQLRLGCPAGAFSSTPTTSGASASFSTTANGGLRRLNARIRPTPAGEIRPGVPYSEWLCQEPTPGDVQAPFGAPGLSDSSGSYTYVGIRSAGSTLSEGQMAYAHVADAPSGWGCDLFLCIRGSGSCRIP